MGDYKDKNGASRVGDLLRELGKSDFIEKAATMVTQGVSGNWVGAVKTLMTKDPDVTPEQEARMDKVIESYYLDLANARAMYTETDHAMTDDIAQKVIKFNLPTIIALVVVNIAAVMLLEGKGEVIAIVSNFIGIAIGHLFNERQSVINFFFGSSQGSKEKTNLINKK